jgi:hypothetical protein
LKCALKKLCVLGVLCVPVFDPPVMPWTMINAR